MITSALASGNKTRGERGLNLIGVNFSLDSAAALLQDGKVRAAAVEERFDRNKHSAAFPAKALAFCLNAGQARLDEVDAIAVSWNPAVHLAQPNRLRDTIYRDHREYMDIIPAQLLHLAGDREVGDHLELTVELANRRLQIHYFDHHLCHAAGAYVASRFPEAAILTADGFGERTSTLRAVGRRGRVEKLGTVDFPHSLGSVYAAVTQFLGFRPNSGEGKVMALAGMGNPERFRSEFERLLRPYPGGFEVDLSYFAYYQPGRNRFSDKFVRTFGPPRSPEGELTADHLDLAAALQEATEDILLHLARELRAETGMDRLCLAGGVMLNAVAMGRLEREAGFDEVFILPAAHDGGGPLGATYLLAQLLGEDIDLTAPFCDRLGPASEPAAVREALDKYNLRYQTPAEPTAAAAEMIADGKIIAWMNGAMEYGPRALGARSILADPRDPRSKERTNAKVKFREAFRPFAPVGLLGEVDAYFENARPTPFMNKVYRVRPEVVERIPAVVHFDGSVRVQTVTRAEDAALFELISHFEARTGVPMVLNTSFNRRGEPICQSVDDALACFFASGLDALFVGDCLLEK